MTDTQIKHILKLISEPDSTISGTFTPLLYNFMMVLNKEENLYSDITRWRYRFDFTNNLIERILVKKYSNDRNIHPANPDHYDVVTTSDGVTVYEYITDSKGNLMKDIYMMSSVIMFIPSPEVNL